MVTIGNFGNLKNSKLCWAALLIAALPWAVTAQQIDLSQPGAVVDNADVVQAYTGLTYAYDNNLFRTPAAQSLGQPTSDSSVTRIGGLILDKSFGRQHLTANFDVSRTTYDRFNYIDYSGKDAQANWAWGVTRDVSGNLGMSYSESLTPYTEFHEPVLNLRTQQTAYLNENWLMIPEFQVHGSLTENRTGYNLLSQQFGDAHDRAGDLGFDFLSAKGNTLGFVFHHDSVVYPVQQILGAQTVNNNFVENDVRLNLDWSLTGHTHAQLTVGRVQRKYVAYQERNVDGPTVMLNVTYLATGKTSLAMSAWREISASQDINVSYTDDRGISLSALWDPLDKIRVQAALKMDNLDYSSASLFTSLLPQDRIDIMRSNSLSVTYTPLRRVQFSFMIYEQNLTSTYSIYNYRDRGLSLNGRMAF